MVSPKTLLIVVFTVAVGGTVLYAVKDSGKQCAGTTGVVCPRYYECVLESNEPQAPSVCRFRPGGLSLRSSKYKYKEADPQEKQVDPQVTDFEQTEQAKRLAYAHNKFGFELLKTLTLNNYVGANKDFLGNVVISPSSVEFALSLAYTGAGSGTRDEMSSTLQLSGLSLTQLLNSSRFLHDRLSTSQNDIFYTNANSLWVSDGRAFKEDFSENAKKYFGAQVSTINFQDPQSPKTINNWVSGATGGKIPSIVPDPIPESVVSYIINAVYFKADWKYKFDKSQTREKDFTNQDGKTSRAPMMSLSRDDFDYLENEDFSSVRLPYGKSGQYNMYLFLPSQSLNELVVKMNIDNWEAWKKEFAPREGTVEMPKFTVSYAQSLVEPLKVLGMKRAFDPQAADFPLMFDQSPTESEKFFIGDVLHKAVIEVNEEGSEAAAATSVAVEATAFPDKEKPKPFELILNRPFLYTIVNEKTGAVVFSGVVRSF